jgi:hypothetical protein
LVGLGAVRAAVAEAAEAIGRTLGRRLEPPG